MPGLHPTPRDANVGIPALEGSPRGHPELRGFEVISDRKEFGVQTGESVCAVSVVQAQLCLMGPWFLFAAEIDLAQVLSGVEREETDSGIEFKGPFNNKKVRIKSADKPPREKAQKKPMKIEERPKWGYQNPSKKKPVKQSARDPFYEQKKQRSEVTREERQRALRELQAKHSPRNTVVQETVASRSRSLERTEERPPPSQAPKSPLTLRHEDYDAYARDTKQTPRAPSPPRMSVRHRSPSPPVPAIRHKLDTHYDVDAYNYEHRPQVSSRAAGAISRYTDEDPLRPPVTNGDFVPFVRTTDLLDPSQADNPVPVSREASAVERGRKAYRQELNPAKYGQKMDNIRDQVETKGRVSDHCRGEELVDLPTCMNQPYLSHVVMAEV